MLERGEEIEEARKEKMTAELSPGNPNPFLMVGKEGTVLCANRASDALLEYWGIKKRGKGSSGIKA